jgi:addiction module HigA family antidote
MPDPDRTQYRPTTVSPPGETLAEMLEERGLSQTELAGRTGRPVKTINEIVRGKAAITADTALQFERVLGAPAAFWQDREARYREFLARRAEAERVEGQVGWLEELPVRDMIRFGWIRKAATRPLQILECLGFFGVASVDAWRKSCAEPLAAFRATDRFQSHTGAVAAWLRQGTIEAERLDCAPHDEARLRAAIPDLRALTLESDPDVFIPRLRRMLAACGVAVVFVRPPKGCPVHGATRWLTSTKAIVQLSLRYKSNDQLWFTLFHEIGHLLLHPKRSEFLEGVGGDSPQETGANRFAADTLIPPEYTNRLGSCVAAKQNVVGFANELGIAPGIVVGRLQHDRLLMPSHFNDLKVWYRWVEG